jgi:hypothetical protein
MFEQVAPVSDVDVLASPDAVAAELATSVPRGEDTAALLLLDPDAFVRYRAGGSAGRP